MIHKEIHLNRHYPLVNDPILEINKPILSDNPKKEPNTRAILIIPGGGYAFVSKREADPVVTEFLNEYYCCFTLYYTINHTYPTPQLEVMAAVDYIKKHAKSLHINKDKIAIIGFSAGGHLAASYGMLENDKYLHKILNIENRDASIAALVLCYPVITMTLNTETMQIVTGGNKELIEKLSIEKHVTKDYPPTFIWTTREDDLILPINTEMMNNALEKAKVKHECIIFPHLWHGLCTGKELINLGSYDKYIEDFKLISTWVLKAKNFLDDVLK